METLKNIATALVKAQMEMSNPIKDATNPFFKSKYADLNSVREAVIPVLNKHGISVLQPIVHVDGKNFVKTTLLHESGEMLDSLTEIIYNKQNDAQAQGSGISYARRYGLSSFVCVGADDDDGNTASQPQTPAGRSNAAERLKAAKTLEELAKIYTGLTLKEKEDNLTLKDELKSKLTNKTAA